MDFRSVKKVKEIVAEVKKEGQKRFEENKAAKAKNLPEPYPGDKIFPYKYIAIDTIDSAEEASLPYAVENYKATSQGKDSKITNVMELDYGLGYYFIREAVKEIIKDVASVCKTVIIISHLIEKETKKGGSTAVSQDISLSGKLGAIVCAMADAIGYMYRKPGKPGKPDKMMVSFRTNEGVTTGARQKHLAGKEFEFACDKIVIDDPDLKQAQ